MTKMNADPVETLSGYVSALPTPFRDDGIDEKSFADFCAWQIEQGISGLAVGATTGEAPTLSMAEQRRLVRIAVATARGRVPVIAGVGSNATAHAIELARQAEAEGANGLLAVTPYYNKPSQEGMCRHFRAVHDAAGLPLLLYDVPSRTGCTLTIDTILRLAELPRIVGLKDATGDLTRPPLLRWQLGDAFRLLSGDDATAPDFLALGGHGCISVVANVTPKSCTRLYAAGQRGDQREVRRLAHALAPLVAALFAEGNPVPLKYALSLMGRMSEELRLPLCEASAETRAKIVAALLPLGLAPTTPKPSRLRIVGGQSRPLH